MTTITPDVLDVLRNCTTDGLKLVLPGQLDRKTYVTVDKFLGAVGGKWNTKAKGHLFADPAGPILAALIEAGQVDGSQIRDQRGKSGEDVALGWFATQPEVVDMLLDFADLDDEDGLDVLEPSAGEGAIAGPVAVRGHMVDCVEVHPGRAQKLRDAGFGRVGEFDFLQFHGWGDRRYDRVVMNPPFAKDVDLRHVLHAETFLRPGGRLVAVMAAGVEFRQDRKWVAFRSLVEGRGGWITRLPDEAFKQAGTGIRTVIVVIPAREASNG